MDGYISQHAKQIFHAIPLIIKTIDGVRPVIRFGFLNDPKRQFKDNSADFVIEFAPEFQPSVTKNQYIALLTLFEAFFKGKISYEIIVIGYQHDCWNPPLTHIEWIYTQGITEPLDYRHEWGTYSALNSWIVRNVYEGFCKEGLTPTPKTNKELSLALFELSKLTYYQDYFQKQISIKNSFTNTWTYNYAD